MERWRFALSARWLGYLALAIAFAVACSALGMWQFARRAEAATAIERVDRNYSASPQPFSSVLRAPDSFDRSQEWLRVTLTGEYLPEEQLLVRNRPRSTPGFEVLTPLQLADGTIFVVDRGWLPGGAAQDAPDVVPAPPSGEVTVVARLRPGEPTLPGRSAPAGQVATIHLPAIAELLGRTTYTGAYGLMESESPPPAVRPAAALEPVRDEGPHLSYAVQWFVFAVLGFLGLGYALREEYRLRNSEDPAERTRAAAREQKRATAPTDAEIEDAIIDSR